MTDIDTSRLRELAEKRYALLDADGDVQGKDREATVLALLDEIDRQRGEVEWEYGLVNPCSRLTQYGSDGKAYLVSTNREHVQAQHRRGHSGIKFVRRRKAGPWEPVDGGCDD